MGEGWAWALLARAGLTRPRAPSAPIHLRFPVTALPQADEAQAAAPWGKHGGVGISQPLQTKIPILCPDAHQSHPAHTCRKAELWAELLHA